MPGGAIVSAMDPDSNGAVAVVVVNWNNWRLTLDCLGSLRRSRGADWHLFVVDNASSDDSLSRLADLGGDVTLVASPANTGWTGGNNLGLRRAMEAGFRRFFILNNDAQVRPDTMALLAGRIGDEGSPIIGPVHRDAEGGTYDFVGAVVDPTLGTPQLMKAHEVDVASLPELYPTAYIRGAGLFVTRRHIDAVGLFDDRYYLNYDEADWCYRARAAGFPVLMMRDAEIVHLGSGSIGGALSPLNIYFLTRNALLFAEEHCSLGQRARHAARLGRWVAGLAPGRSRAARAAASLLGGGAGSIAARRGVRDYLMRRFGDCPPSIRRLSGSR